MDPVDQYERNESSGQPEELFDHSLHWSNIKEESEECEIQQSGPVVSLRDTTSQVSQTKNTETQDSSFIPVSDNAGVTDYRHKEITCLKVKVLPVKEESEECFLQQVDELASSTVKKEENEDWLKSDDEDVEKVTVPWETSETSPSCSDTEQSEIDGDHVQDCEVHEHEVSGGLKIEDCSRTLIDQGTTPDTQEKANTVMGESKGGSSFYPCPHCALGFTIERFFHRHLKRDHREQYMDMLNSGEIMTNHVTCPECGKCFSNNNVMNTHLRSHTGEKPYHCAECGRNYALADSLKKHKCKKGFRRQAHLTGYKMIKTVERPYKCTQCGKGYRFHSQLISHEMIHAGARPYKCPQCGKGYQRPGHLKRHQMTHTEVRPYGCLRCKKSFFRPETLKAHQKTHTGERPFKCSHCDKGFGFSRDLRRHQVTHTRETPTAGKPINLNRFKTAPSQLEVRKEQQNTQEEKPKPFKCCQCDKGFGFSRDLRRHQLTHTGEKPFNCPQCEKCFGRKWELTYHLRTHSGEKPYHCTECGQKFSLRGNFKRHQQVHTGEKSFHCTQCDKSFFRAAHLKTHLLIHSGTKKLLCSSCGKGFNQEGNLKRHLPYCIKKLELCCDI